MDLIAKFADAGSMLWTTLGYGERLAVLYLAVVVFGWLLSIYARDRKRRAEDRERRIARMVALELRAG